MLTKFDYSLATFAERYFFNDMQLAGHAVFFISMFIGIVILWIVDYIITKPNKVKIEEPIKKPKRRYSKRLESNNINKT